MKDRLVSLVAQLKNAYTRRRTRNPEEALIAEIYPGYRSTHKLFVQGRLLEFEDIQVSNADRRWTNFVNALRRLKSDEIAGASMEIVYDEHSFELVTDSEGYFTLHVRVGAHLSHDAWEPVTVRITSLPFGKAPLDHFTGAVANLTYESKVAVITDIDDTLLKTGVTSLFKLRALYRTLVDNAYTRMPFAGAAELLSALASGPADAEESNPVFYLSNSPWNLFGLLQEFLSLKSFPRGPLFLRDFGLPYENSPKGGSHKSLTIRRLIEDFPSLKFVLIGDSGEKDADIYHAAAQEFPERIKAIIIRNVKNNANARRIQRMFSRQPAELNYYLVRDSGEAAKVLAALDLLNEQQVQVVEAAKFPN